MRGDVVYSAGNRTTAWNEKNGVAFVTFTSLDGLGVKHGFSTRLGGVSEGEFSAMNLGFARGDDPEAVRENHRRFAEAVGYDAERLVFSDQVHGDEIRMVTGEDAGKGMVRESDIVGVDGLATAEKGLPLITFYADCVPLFFYDPVKEVVGLAHSGWKGTALRIGGKMVRKMGEWYGCRPEDLHVAIGPSICGDCYEVGEDVAIHFIEGFLDCGGKGIVREKGGGKYWLSLWKANEDALLDAGVARGKLSVTDLCTRHNPHVLYSHRASGGRRGSLAAVISL